ncbi:hypothetical protein LFL96_00490 [Paraburkholderia sp. D15]|nr:hypothetical protein [Paraburkholderia sp. D15]WGS50026.1 hypothetical protein LFL96_00490 [Paraburkholderia sp. D15]
MSVRLIRPEPEGMNGGADYARRACWRRGWLGHLRGATAAAPARG